MAGFDDEVGEDFVKGADCAGEGWGVVAEGYEEGGYWEGLLESVGSLGVGLVDLRSSELKTWPFWRTRARGSAMVCGLWVCWY